MTVLIQQIKTTWSKQSRGHPDSQVRNAVPEYYRINGIDLEEGILFQSIDYTESDLFQRPRVKIFEPISESRLRELGLYLEIADGECKVSNWKASGRSKSFVTLGEDEWSRKVVYSHSMSFEHVDEYHKVVRNFYFGEGKKSHDVISTKEPVCTRYGVASAKLLNKRMDVGLDKP
ncbi:hypothetical protein MNBD_GAMMA12-1958 [hydrothermal vent metagenome]|uniref:Uncharacterized protein n=1 Tax=hydrothermal vent metagenome TaxID=652676 RepID=A0A3B0Z6R0_9ZZZZ